MSADSDIAQSFKAKREASQARRAEHRRNAAAQLNNIGIRFRSNNFGAHLLIEHKGRRVDFWPGTGLFTSKGWPDGRGLKNLLKKLEVEEKP